MQWLMAAERDLVRRKTIKEFISQIGVFIGRFGDSEFIDECFNYWQSDKGILLHFRSGFSRIDLSFLSSIALEDSLSVVCASKASSLLRGYNIVGITKNECGKLFIVKRKRFSGLGSKKWHTMSLGKFGYSIFIHAQGRLNVTRYVIENWKLQQQVVVPNTEDPCLFKKVCTLERFFALHSKLEKGDIERMAAIIYNNYRMLRRSVVFSQDEEEPWLVNSQEREGSGSKL